MTRIAVCIPTYNRPQELARLLESIAGDVNIYVSDNGGVLTPEFRQRFPSVRFSSTVGAPVAMFPNWNLAAKMAETEEWLLVPSDDDIYYPDSFDQITAAIQQHSDAGIVVFGHHVVGESYEILSTWQPDAGVMKAPEGFERFKFGVDARMPSVAIRRSVMQRLGYFDEHYVYSASDSDVVQRALLLADAVFVPAVVSGYRVWQRGATHSTLATAGWLNDIDYWGGKIELLLLETPQYSREARQVRDELYARNLLAGLHLLRRQGAADQCLAHFRRNRYPGRARWITQLKIIRQVLLAFRR